MRKLSDRAVLAGFQSFDATITRDFFYGYCRRAYNVLDAKYQLHQKEGLDFYSLAHDYYIQLLTHDFRPLMERPEGMPLSSWMYGGFRFVALDALKAYNKEYEAVSTTSADEVAEYVHSGDSSGDLMAQVEHAVMAHYHDRRMQEIAHLVFYQGFKQKEVAALMGLTPAAVNQRYKKMMDEVVAPFVMEYYGTGLGDGIMASAPRAVENTTAMSESLASAILRAPLWHFKYKCVLDEKEKNMEGKRITSAMISSLKENEIFVFGSNLQGIHAGGAARTACMRFGAVIGQGVGLQGQSYAIPTMQGGVETIRPYVDEFLEFARQHEELHFLVTPVGCGIAGFLPRQIAPLFAPARNINNVWLPECFWEELGE